MKHMATTNEPREMSDGTLHHLVTAVLYTIVSIIALGLIYPLVIWAIASRAVMMS